MVLYPVKSLFEEPYRKPHAQGAIFRLSSISPKYSQPIWHNQIFKSEVKHYHSRICQLARLDL